MYNKASTFQQKAAVKRERARIFKQVQYEQLKFKSEEQFMFPNQTDLIELKGEDSEEVLGIIR